MVRLDMTHESMRHYYRGRVFESTGELNIAIEEYQKSIELGANYADVHNALGRVYAKTGRFEDAIREFKYALQLNPQYLEAQRNLVEIESKLPLIRKEDLTQSKQQESISQIQKTEFIGKATSAELIKKTVEISLIKVLISLSLIVLLIIVGIYFLPKLLLKEKIVSVGLPSSNITGITYSNRKLWACDLLKQEIYQWDEIRNRDFILKNTYHTDIFPLSITFDGNYLYTCDTWNNKIYRHIPDNKLTIVKKYDIKNINITGICWDNNNIWSIDNINNKIYKHNMDETLSVNAIFNSPVEKIIAFVYDGKNYWSVSGSDNTVYKHKNDPALSIEKSYKISKNYNKKISAVFINKKYVWIIYEGEPQLYIYPKNEILY